jgi:hypothetical protein
MPEVDLDESINARKSNQKQESFIERLARWISAIYHGKTSPTGVNFANKGLPIQKNN